MALTEITKVKIRDHLRFGIAGLYRISPAGGTVASGMIGYRFFQAYGTLEYRMNNMNASEEAMVTGNAMGAIAFTGPNPDPGDAFTANISGGGLSVPVQITVTAEAGDQPAVIAAKIAGAINGNQTLQLAGFYASAGYGAGPFGQGTTIPLPEVSIVSAQPFQLSATTASITGAAVTLQGQQVGYSATFDGIAGTPGLTTIFGYVPILDALKGAIASASQNLDTKRADVWFGRGSEPAQRLAMYQRWRMLLADFMGLQLNDTRNRLENAGAVRYR